MILGGIGAFLTKFGAVNAAWKMIDGFHRWICSAAGILALAALWENTTPLALLSRFGVHVKPVVDFISADAWQRGLLYSASAVALLALVGLLSAGNESGWGMAALEKRDGKYTLEDRRKDRKLIWDRDYRNYGWMWLATVVFVQLHVLTPDRIWLFALGVISLRSAVESWRVEDTSRRWHDRGAVFVINAGGAGAVGLLAAAALPLRLFGLFSYPLSQRAKGGPPEAAAA